MELMHNRYVIEGHLNVDRILRIFGRRSGCPFHSCRPRTPLFSHNFPLILLLCEPATVIKKKMRKIMRMIMEKIQFLDLCLEMLILGNLTWITLM
ncbi:hypothetical protein SUGI_0233800, partial [Cryptomeria japonica]